jgi:hypothetical protein
MKISPRYRLEKAVSTDEEFRPAMCQLYLHDLTVAATNGVIVALAPIERDLEDVDGFIPPKALTDARSLKEKEDEALVIEQGDVTRAPTNNGDLAIEYDLNMHDAKYPMSAFTLIPKDQERQHFEVGINAKALHALAEALGCEAVRLSFSKNPTASVLVRPLYDDGARGAIMPIRLRHAEGEDVDVRPDLAMPDAPKVEPKKKEPEKAAPAKDEKPSAQMALPDNTFASGPKPTEETKVAASRLRRIAGKGGHPNAG